MLVYLICYLAAVLFARVSCFALSGLPLLLAAAWLCREDFGRPGPAVRLRGLFSLSFVGGQGLSCLKLSRLQVPWEPMTWAVLFLAHSVFWLVFELLLRRVPAERCSGGPAPGAAVNPDRLLAAILVLTGVSAGSFAAEALILGFIPLLLRGVPHAYSYFHVSGLHYFTVSCCLVPSLSLVWQESDKKADRRKLAAAALCSLTAFLVPVFLVSRFYLVFTVLLAAVTLLFLRKGAVPRGAMAAVPACILPLYILLSVARSHSVEYLNGIFEMKYRLPIFVTQPYIYIAHNYDNLNCLIRELPRHSMGLKMLFPLWALTGLKLFVPSLTAFPLYVTKEELTTVTLFYDAWYDFGTAGVVLLSGLLGASAFVLERRISGPCHPVETVICAQFAMYLGLSFFTTWFSNPATWFLFAVSALVLDASRERGGAGQNASQTVSGGML